MKKILVIGALIATPCLADIWGDAADAGRKLGGDVSGAAHHAGAVLSDAAHHSGRVLSDETKRLAAALTDEEVDIVNSIDDNVQGFVNTFNPVEAARQIALSAAGKYYDEHHASGDKADCTLVVAAVCAYYASAGGPVGAALGAGGGVAMGDWACGSWYR